jgi:hypothetical protein
MKDIFGRDERLKSVGTYWFVVPMDLKTATFFRNTLAGYHKERRVVIRKDGSRLRCRLREARHAFILHWFKNRKRLGIRFYAFRRKGLKGPLVEVSWYRSAGS